MGSHDSGKKSRPKLREIQGNHKSPGKGKSISPRTNSQGERVWTEEEIRNGTAIAENPTVIRFQETRQCDVHRVIYTEPNDLVRFGTLVMAGGVQWDVCGDCITALWNLRNPGMEGA